MLLKNLRKKEINFLALPNGSMCKNNHLTFTNLLKTFHIDGNDEMN